MPFKIKPMHVLLIFVPLALIAELAHGSAVLVFVLAALGVIPQIGRAHV